MSEANKKYVVLISPQEKLRFDWEDTTFWYRRMPPSKHAELANLLTERGVFAENHGTELLLMVARYCLIGWDNLVNHEGTPIPFLEEVIDYLPGEILSALSTRAFAPAPEEVMARFFASSTNGGPSNDQAASP